MTFQTPTKALVVADAYAEAREEGYSNAGAYEYARHIAGENNPMATEYLDDPSTGSFPTVVYTFADGSRARVMFGGVRYGR